VVVVVLHNTRLEQLELVELVAVEMVLKTLLVTLAMPILVVVVERKLITQRLHLLEQVVRELLFLDTLQTLQ
jgi:hypothetical protein